MKKRAPAAQPPSLTAAELIVQLSKLRPDTYVYLLDYGFHDPEGTMLGIEGVTPVLDGPLKGRQVIVAHSRGPSINRRLEHAPESADSADDEERKS